MDLQNKTKYIKTRYNLMIDFAKATELNRSDISRVGVQVTLCS
jgi:hypothetical protein